MRLEGGDCGVGTVRKRRRESEKRLKQSFAGRRGFLVQSFPLARAGRKENRATVKLRHSVVMMMMKQSEVSFSEGEELGEKRRCRMKARER